MRCVDLTHRVACTITTGPANSECSVPPPRWATQATSFKSQNRVHRNKNTPDFSSSSRSGGKCLRPVIPPFFPAPRKSEASRPKYDAEPTRPAKEAVRSLVWCVLVVFHGDCLFSTGKQGLRGGGVPECGIVALWRGGVVEVSM